MTLRRWPSRAEPRATLSLRLTGGSSLLPLQPVRGKPNPCSHLKWMKCRHTGLWRQVHRYRDVCERGGGLWFIVWNSLFLFQIVLMVNFSSRTTSLDIQRNLEANVEKRTKDTYGPPMGKRLLVFMDDMNMPKVVGVHGAGRGRAVCWCVCVYAHMYGESTCEETCLVLHA